MTTSTKLTPELTREEFTMDMYLEGALRTEAPMDIPVPRIIKEFVAGVDREESLARSCIASILSSIMFGGLADNAKRQLFYGAGGKPWKTIEQEVEAKMNSMGDVLNGSDKKVDEMIVRLREWLLADLGRVRLLHVILGISSELSEFAEEFFNAFQQNRDPDRTNMLEELGDFGWYGNVGADVFSSSLVDIAFANVKKLMARHSGKFSQERVVNRDLQNEHQVLETSLEHQRNAGHDRTPELGTGGTAGEAG